MALPASVNKITITGTYMKFDGSAASGDVTFVPPSNAFLKVTDVDIIILPGPVKATLDINGSFTVTLPVTNDPDIIPSFTYAVTENVGGLKRAYSIELPIELGSGPINLADIAPTGAAVSGTTALTRTVADQLYALKDAGPTGGAVASVAGRTGIVVLSKADVGLPLVDNTSDANKPISTAQAAALAAKANTSALSAVALSGSAADLSGVLPTSALPALAINTTTPVASQAAMLALSAQRGDVAVRTDTGKSYILATDNPGTLADWIELQAVGKVTSVAGQQGIVVLSKTDVGLPLVDNTSDANKPISIATQAALDAKMAPADLVVDPSTMTSSFNPTTKVLSVGVIPGVSALNDLADVTAVGATQGQQLTKMPDGSWGSFGIPTIALPTGTVIPANYPRPLEAIYYDLSVPDLRFTLAHGSAGASVTNALEGMNGVDTANKALYVADGAVPTGQATVARFTPASTLIYLSHTGLAWSTLYGRFFFFLEAGFTGNQNICEVRSTTDALSVLQNQPDGSFQIKNKATNVKQTTTVFTAAHWYRCDFKIGASSQRWRFYDGNSATILEDSGDVGAFTGIPSEIRVGHTVGNQAFGVVRLAALDLSDESLSYPWAA